MTGRVQWRDEFWGIYRMDPTIGRELRDPGAIKYGAVRPGLLSSAPGLLRAVDSHRKAPRMACSGSR